MTRLKNITNTSVLLQMFETKTPTVSGTSQEVTLALKPGEDVDESLWLVTNEHSTSYNAAIIDNYIQKNILSRI